MCSLDNFLPKALFMEQKKSLYHNNFKELCEISAGYGHPCNVLVPVLHQSFSLFCNSLFFTSMVQRSAIPEGGKVIQSGKKNVWEFMN